MRDTQELCELLQRFPVYDRYDQCDWVPGPGIESTYQWVHPNRAEREKWAHEYQLGNCIEHLSSTPIDYWDRTPHILYAMLFLHEASPGLIETPRKTGINPIKKYPVMTQGARLSMMYQPITMKPHVYLYKHTSEQIQVEQRQNGTIQLAKPALTGEGLKQNLLHSLRNTYYGTYHIQDTLRCLYNEVRDKELGGALASPHLYAAWVYWMLHEGTDEDVAQARMIATLESDSPARLSRTSLLRVVEHTALRNTMHNLDPLELQEGA